MKPDHDSDRIQVEGHEVYLDGKRIAECSSDEAALVVGIVLAYVGNERRTPFGWKQRIERFFA